MTLRAYQRKAVEDLTSSRSDAVLVMHTGLGKTRTLSELALLEVERGGRVLWLAHRRELVFQAAASLRDAWLTVGTNCFVKSIQELLAKQGPPDITLLVLDESHHYVAQEWATVRGQYPDAWTVGASATPERADGIGLGAIFSRMVLGPTRREAIAGGYLVPADVIRPEKALAPGEVAQDPVKAFETYAKGKKAMLFAPSVEVAIQYACRFRDELGVRAACVWGEMPTKDRASVMAKFAADELDVLTSVAALTEGVDVPQVECIIIARTFGSAGAMIQAVGRGARPHPSKRSYLVLDLVGCTHTFGEPDDEREYFLEGRGIRRPNDELAVKWCPVCGHPVVGEVCLECGHEGRMKLRPPRVLGLPVDRFARFIAEPDDERAKRLARWIREGRSKGHKEGAACHRFKGVYQMWPSQSVLMKARNLAR